MEARRKETALYEPLKLFLEALGCEVKGEVRDCDLVAVRGDDLIIVEMKNRMNLTLVLQCISRLRLTDLVYLAVEAPKRRDRPQWCDIRRLCRRLGLGLLAVHFGTARPIVEVIHDPGPYRPRLDTVKRRRLLGEFRLRTGDRNTGGGNRRPIITAYREQALLLADQLERRGELTVKQLREATGCPKAGAILHDNHYEWFEWVRRGCYRLSPRGKEALKTYQDVVECHRNHEVNGEEGQAD